MFKNSREIPVISRYHPLQTRRECCIPTGVRCKSKSKKNRSQSVRKCLPHSPSAPHTWPTGQHPIPKPTTTRSTGGVPKRYIVSERQRALCHGTEQRNLYARKKIECTSVHFANTQHILQCFLLLLFWSFLPRWLWRWGCHLSVFFCPGWGCTYRKCLIYWFTSEMCICISKSPLLWVGNGLYREQPSKLCHYSGGVTGNSCYIVQFSWLVFSRVTNQDVVGLCPIWIPFRNVQIKWSYLWIYSDFLAHEKLSLPFSS